jgi:hypothetical protein
MQMEISLKDNGKWMKDMGKVLCSNSLGIFTFADGEAKEIEYSFGKRL